MAKIVLGMGSSHGPMLSTPPEDGGLRVSADRRNQHPFKGKCWSFDQLVELRKSENLSPQIERQVWRDRHAADARKWYRWKLAPMKYGDRIDIDARVFSADLTPPPTERQRVRAVRLLLAQLQAKAQNEGGGGPSD